MEENVDIKKQDNRQEQLRKQEAEIAKRQEQQAQRTRIEHLLRFYQDANALAKIEVSTLAVNVRKDVVSELSSMVNIIERDDWFSVHLHDAFPNIDIRMLAYGCPASMECPFLQAVLRKIKMQRSDYINYRKRMGMMIMMEHSRKALGVNRK
jgi:hypothetical protein